MNNINEKNFLFFKKNMLIFLIMLSIIQQMPLIKDYYYEYFRIALYIGFGFIALISIGNTKSFLSNKFNTKLLFLTIYSIALFFINSIKGISFNLFEVLIPFGIVFSTYKTIYSKKQIRFILLSYILLSLILGLSSIFYYGNGFNLTTNYFLLYKNQIGPIIGISNIICIYSLFYTNIFPKKLDIFLFKFLICLLLFLSVVFIRNRAGILSILVTFITMLFNEHKYMNNLVNSILILISLIIIYFFLLYFGIIDKFFDILFNSFFLNYNILDLNSISAGRTEIYLNSVIYIFKNPFFGDLGNFIQSGLTPHNYVLYKVVRLGILGALPYVYFYFNLWQINLKDFLKFEIRDPLKYVLLFSLIVSLFEYTYPFGPGVSQLILWFLIGQRINLSFEYL